MSPLDSKKILLTGSGGFLGQFVLKNLLEKRKIDSKDLIVPRSRTDDLRDLAVCERLVKDIDVVIHVAGRTGGIGFNKRHPGSLFYDNIIMNTQLMEASRREGVSKFVGVGTVCSYPKFTPVPFVEEDLWSGYPEETNASYGLAKKMMLVQGQAYRQEYDFNAVHLLMVNLYGPGDNFDPEDSHVIPSLVRKFVDAKDNDLPFVTLWGSGKASREFLYVADSAEAIIAATERYDGAAPVNIGSGNEVSISVLAETISCIVGYEGELRFDATRPDGQPRRCLDISKAEREFGFKAMTGLEQGLGETIAWYRKFVANHPQKE
jgi:GDP-L-fucose synthase